MEPIPLLELALLELLADCLLLDELVLLPVDRRALDELLVCLLVPLLELPATRLLVERLAVPLLEAVDPLVDRLLVEVEGLEAVGLLELPVLPAVPDFRGVEEVLDVPRVLDVPLVLDVPPVLDVPLVLDVRLVLEVPPGWLALRDESSAVIRGVRLLRAEPAGA